MPRPPAPCGTEAAYRRHKRKGEEVDEQCMRAAAAARATRRTGKQRAEQPVGQIAPDLFTPGGADALAAGISPAAEYPRLYLVLNTVLPLAMPREVSSIVREMRGLLQEMEKTSPPGKEKSLSEQLEEAKREAAERRAAHRAAASAVGAPAG